MSMFSLIFMMLALGGMMFFMSRSQKKQQNERQALLDSMKIGDKIVTIGGLHGVISEINNEARTVSIDCEGIILEFDRAAIKTVKPVATATTEAIEEAATPIDEKEEISSEENETKE